MLLLHFIFRLDVVMWVVALLATAGLGVLALDDFRLAKVCFLFAAAWAVGGVITWGVKTTQPIEVKLSIGAILFVIIGIFTIISWRYVNKKRETKAIAVGNLKQRANELADDILLDLYLHGWQQCIPIDTKHKWKLKYIEQIPTDSDELRKWQEDRSEHFKFNFYDDVVALRDEFAQFHFRDNSIDGFIKQYNDQQKDYVSVHQILDIAEQLKTMAGEIK